MRTLENPHFKIACFPVPKVASTSIKHAFYKLKHGKPFDRDSQPDPSVSIHEGYFKTRPFYNIDHSRYVDYARIAIVRDPARRILSAYHHRVEQARELSAGQIDMDLARALRVQPNPGREAFLCNIEAYRMLSESIRHHTDPFTSFLGPDLSYFTDVVKLGQIDKLSAQISVLVGQEFELGHHHKAASAAVGLQMGKRARNALLTYCAGDYALLQGYFSAPEDLNPKV